jgi:hypothetical protein
VVDTAYGGYRRRIQNARTRGLLNLEAARELVEQRRAEVDEATRARDAAIVDALLAGASVTDVADVAGLSAPRVYTIRAEHYSR